MWSNGASRRGRRMSLDLPPIPMTPKDSEFLQRRPDLFYPYLPAPFLNGMQQKVLFHHPQFSRPFFNVTNVLQINEISVVQGPQQNGMSVTNGKYGGLLGFGGYPPPPSNNSPERQDSRPPSREPERLWDLHFERKAASETREDLLPPSREGLAA